MDSDKLARPSGSAGLPSPKPPIPAKPTWSKRPPQKPPRDPGSVSPPGQSSPSQPPKHAPPPTPPHTTSCPSTGASSARPDNAPPPPPPYASAYRSSSTCSGTDSETPPVDVASSTSEQSIGKVKGSISSDSFTLSLVGSPEKRPGNNIARISSPSSSSVMSSDSEDETEDDNEHREEAWYGVVKISKVDQPKWELEAEPEESCSSEMTPAEKANFKLFKIAEELMTTEDTYVCGLELLVIDLRQALEEANKEGRCKLDGDTMKKIFSILPEIYGIHLKMLKELKERLGQWETKQRIGDIMLSFAPFLKVYANFTLNFEQAIQTIADLTKHDKKFHALIKAFESQPKCRMLGIAHFMLEPVQRIPRYKLLLVDYLKKLPQDSEDLPDTEKALVLVSAAADHANGMMKELENFTQMMLVQTSLVDKGNFAQPGRSLVRHGILMKSSRKSFQQRHFFLFNDILLHCAPVNGSPFGEGGLYKIRDRLPVYDLQLDEPLVSPLPNSFMVISVHRSICLAANSEDEKREWMGVLQECIKEARQRIQNMHRASLDANGEGAEADGGPSTQQLGMVAPVWVHDQSTSMCMDCADTFTVLRRRHHCRCCGKVVCSNCSTNTIYLEYCKRKERVCDSCYTKLGGDVSKTAKKKQKKTEGPGVREIKGYDVDSNLTGYLQLKSGRSWKRYWFQVKDLALFWYKAPEDVVATGNQPLPGLTLELVKKGNDGTDREYCFKVFHKNVTTLVFSADSEDEQDRWMKVLGDAISGNL